MALIKFDVSNRFTGKVQFTAEIECDENTSYSVKLGLAVKWAVKAHADLTGANLTHAYLARADLARANLADANLTGANLTHANLTGAYLARADLARANLADANLTGAYLARAYLARADLARANLADANLAGADLARANLAHANLTGAKGAELAIARTRILPDGEIIGWKKCNGGVIVKLRIPAEARRSHAFGRKCRTEFADVLEVIGGDCGVSQHDDTTMYKTGERVTCHEWSEDWQEECAGGIHFYITRLEAENH